MCSKRQNFTYAANNQVIFKHKYDATFRQVKEQDHIDKSLYN